MPRSPIAVRRELGAELQRLRLTAGLDGETAAQTINCSASRIMRLEAGVSAPVASDITALVSHYGAGDTAAGRLTDLCGEAEAVPGGVATQFYDVAFADSDAVHLHGVEQDASALSLYEPFLLPGLVQTPAYALAVAQQYYPAEDAEYHEAFVALRLTRQQRLQPAAEAPATCVIIAPATLDLTIGGAGVLREQLDHLREQFTGALAHVDFRVAPKGMSDPAALGGAFEIIDFDDVAEPSVVYLEERAGGRYFETLVEVDHYRTFFATVLAACPTRLESLEMVESALRALG